LSNHKIDAKCSEIQKWNCEKANAAKEEEQAKMKSLLRRKRTGFATVVDRKATQVPLQTM
jgi:hypothetical protein